MNMLTILFLVFLILSVSTQWYLSYRHLRHIKSHKDSVPQAFESKIPLDAHQKAADYTSAKVRTGNFELVIASVILLLWTLCGGLQYLDNSLRFFGLPEIWLGTIFIMSVIFISSLLDIPISIYRTFILEEKFGFNKTTPKTFITDLVKSSILLIIIGTPILLLVLWIMESAGSLWWLYVWLTWLVFTITMMWAYPAFIAPLFNKFKPLEDEELRNRIESLLDRNGFTSQGIFVMDGSSRSSHGNAYFTGIGKNKRIVFFDTLIDELSHDEIEAVLAHELGHFKRNHVKKRIALMAIMALIGLAILGWLMETQWFFNGLGVQIQSTHIALILFFMVTPVFTFFLQPCLAYLSRKHEFEADDFAMQQSDANHLIQALVKLYKENANTLTPDPVYSAFHDSHPPAPIRIAHLSGK